jgi:hypothetical protein
MMLRRPLKVVALSLAGFSLPLITVAHLDRANAHPHDALAQCKVTGGKTKMCSETIHDALTNEHVPKDQVHVPRADKTISSGSSESSTGLRKFSR